MPKIVVAIVSLCGLMLFATSYAEEVHIVPDRFQLVGYNNVPRVSIKERHDGYEIKLKIEASAEALMDFLKNKYGKGFSDLDIYEHHLKPTNFQFLSDTFENSSVLKRFPRKTYTSNGIYLNIQTNKDYNKTMLEIVLLFGIVFGTVDAEIECIKEVVKNCALKNKLLCGKTIKGIPVFNQYRRAEYKKLKPSFYEYLALNQYFAFLKMKNLKMDESALDDLVKRTLFRSTDQSCEKDNPHLNVCKIITSHSPSKKQIKEALSVLRKKVYPGQLIEDNHGNHIISSSQFKEQTGCPVVYLQSVKYPSHYIRHKGFLGFIGPIVSELDRKDASFVKVLGYTNPNYISFQSVNYPTHFLRHQNFQIKLQPYDGSYLFKLDATFKPVEGLYGNGGVSFESVNYPGYYIRHSSFALYIHRNDGSELFKKDATFNEKQVVDPVATSTSTGKEKVAILAGNSITDGFRAYKSFLPRTRTWVNHGIPGNTTDDLMKRIPFFPAISQPQEIFVMIGINDLIRNVMPTMVKKNIITIVNQLKQNYPKSLIVIQSILPVRNVRSIVPVAELNKRIRNLNNGLEKMAAQKNGVQYLDLHPFFAQPYGYGYGYGRLKSTLTNDGLHLRPQGYQLWGSKLRPERALY